MRFPIVVTLAAALMTPLAAHAHPGSGIVVDRAGNVYFVRAGQNVVWRLSPDGRVTKFVEDDLVRLPHHLALGRDGTLYFASDFDGRVWRVTPAGRRTEQFNTNRIRDDTAVFVGKWGDPWTIDSAGNVYALAASNGSAIVRITPAGVVTAVARNARFGQLHLSSMVLGTDGALYLTDANRVWRVVGDSATAIVPRGVGLESGAGVAVSADGSVYVADWQSKRVLRLSRDGAVSTPPVLSRLPLSNPWGVTLGPDGSVYVLDHLSNGRGVAVWRVRGERAERLYSARSGVIYFGAAMITLFPLLLAVQTMVRRPSNVADWALWTVAAGLIVGGLWWVARDTFGFAWTRHIVVALFAYGAWRSWRRRASSAIGAA